MANQYQQATKRRKLIYWVAIGALLMLSLLVRGTFFRIDRMTTDDVNNSSTLALTMDGRAKAHELTELQQGDKELGGAAVQLLLTGSRGLAVCALWLNAYDKQRKQEWNELDISVDSITKLQPHFSAPWLFQSWNLAYNVSVEMDRLNDMYFYIARGISILAEGESLNRNNPDLRWNVGFYFQNKFGVSDRVTTLRCLYQLSCIPDEDRDPEKLVTVASDNTRSVNLAAFEQFCQANPQLIRRLKETRVPVDGSIDRAHPLASSPDAVVAFLRANRKLPSRYKTGTRDLNDRLKQFPVLPDLTNQPVTTEEVRFTEHLADYQSDAFIASRAWYSLANCALPPPNPKPNSLGTFNPDPLKYRIPKRPATIIFRQGPVRAQTYLAERLTKEGWFNREPWFIDDLIDPDRAWIPKIGVDGQRVKVALSTIGTAQEAWAEAARRWQEHGTANGLRMDPARLQSYLGKAEEFCRLKPGLFVGELTPPLTPEEAQNETLLDLHEAHEIMHGWAMNRQLTNYENFEVEAVAMQTDQAMLAKKFFHQADKAVRDAANYPEAVRLYDEAFAAWKQVLVARQDCRERRARDQTLAPNACRDFRDLERYQEDVYELNLRYVRLSQDVRQQELRSSVMWLNDLTVLAGPAALGNPFALSTSLNVLAQEQPIPGAKPGDPLSYATRVSQLKSIKPLPLPGPMDELAPDGTPWISDTLKDRVKERLGIIKRAALSSPPGGPGMPSSAPAGPGRP
jgi:hypothetical protein